MTETFTGKQVFMDTLINEGIDFIFGNPGTTELPLIEALNDYPNIQYIMALHEAVAVSMADGYAHSSGKVGVANLHVGPGLGNGLGSVYNAWEGRTPLIVTAGQQDNRMRLREPLLGHDLVAMAKPLVKWSVEASNADELAFIMHRAFKVAREEPCGPVFVSLPINVMDQRTAKGALHPSNISGVSTPPAQDIEAAAKLLLKAKSPVIFYGDKVARYGAMQNLVVLAEQIGAQVFAEFLPSHVSFPNQHAAFIGRSGQDYRTIRNQTDGADAVLLVGGEFFEEVWFTDTTPFPDNAPIVQIDPDPSALGKNIRVDCGLLGEPARTLAQLSETLESLASKTFLKAAQNRLTSLRGAKSKRDTEQAARSQTPDSELGIATATMSAIVRDTIPANTIISGEPITAGVDLLKTLNFEHCIDYLAARGGGIGQGLPSAVGMKLAHPNRPVLCLSGDGSSLYTIQTLWSAVHHNLAVVFLILNNRTYRILKLNMNRYRAEAQVADRGYQHLDLDNPEMDFVHIARGFGMQATRVTQSAQLGDAIKNAFAAKQPWLLEVRIDGSV